MSKVKKPITKRWWFWAIVVFFALGIIGAIAGDDSAEAPESSPVVEDTAEPEGTAQPSVEQEETDPELGTYRLTAGELLDVNPEGGVDGTTLVIKVKIQGLLNNEMTINQNFHNVESIIKQGGDQYECIDYWAVADMQDGSEQKVVAFTVSSDVIQGVASGNIVATQLVDYVDDLFIHPSLQAK